LNDEEFLTLDNNNKATVWNVNVLIKKNEFTASGGNRWSDNKNYDISYGNLIKAGKNIILYRQASYVNGEVFVFDSKSYQQIWRIQHTDDERSAISYDLKTLYIPNAKIRLWYSGRFYNHVEEYEKEHKKGRPGRILKIDLSLDKWSYTLKEDFKRRLYIPLSRAGAGQQLSPTRQYYITGYNGNYTFHYPEEYLRLGKYFLQFKNGEAAFFSHITNNFQITANARKHLKMKNNQGDIIPINDATFERYNRTGIEHYRW